MIELSEREEQELIREALKAREKAYAPYSGFGVGAALLTKEGKIYLGCNIENSSYGATNCAERTAIFKAVSEGEKDFKAIAIVGFPINSEQGSPFPDYAYPCGICRQVMSEFCSEDFLVLVAKNEGDYLSFRLQELIPHSFS